MSAVVVASLTEQFTRAWDMLLEAADNVPDDQWDQAPDQRVSPTRIVYHVLTAAERYTWLGPADDYTVQREFGLNWIEVPARELLDKPEALRHITAFKAKTLAWIQHFGPDGLVSDAPLWPWTGSCALAQGLYHLRHLQHHLAELSIELRRRGHTPATWR